MDHIPVLLQEVLELLNPQPGQVVLDCTLGRGGHAAAILPKLAPEGRFVGLDVDRGNIELCRPLLQHPGVRVDLVHANFARTVSVLEALNLPGVDLLLADLGFASSQMDDPARGFAFSQDGPLDMRLNPEEGITAAELLNGLPQRELADLLWEFGEERRSRQIAQKIVEIRQREPILTTMGLARLVQSCYARGPRQRIHPATRTFMALRIAVNQELGALDQLLADIPVILNPSGRAAIISFHSLEDRRVKQRMVDLAQSDGWRRLTRKPVMATDREAAGNPRSRSAKLRVVQREAPGGAG